MSAPCRRPVGAHDGDILPCWLLRCRVGVVSVSCRCRVGVVSVSCWRRVGMTICRHVGALLNSGFLISVYRIALGKKRDDAIHYDYYFLPPLTEDPRSYGTGIKHSTKRWSQFNHATLRRRLGHHALVAARLLCLSWGGG
jgi:hypothetical protein